MSTAHTLLAQALAAYDAADANWKPAEWFESVRVYLATPGDQRPAPDYPLMRAAFQTSESGNGRYKAVFQFPTLQCMQAAVMQWHGVQKPLPSPAWCASVDAELAATAEADAGLVDSAPSAQRLERDKLLAARYRFAFIESPEWTYAVCKWDGKDWLPINTEEEEYELDQAMLAATPGIKCLTCSGHGLIGGFQGGAAPGYVSEPCPDCNMPVSTLPAAAVAEGLERDGDALEQAS